MTHAQRTAYGMLGAPLAMAALPVYIYAPKLYVDEFGLGLTLTGVLLLLSRAIDTLQDPWLGRLADRMQHSPKGWSILIVVASICLIAAYTALFNPPATGDVPLGVWLALSLVVVYTAHSALNITYLAWGARASEDSPERTQLVAFREGFGLFGIILASLLPALFTQWLGLSTAWLSFSLVFAVLLLGAVWTLLRHAPCPSVVHSVQQDLFHPLRQRAFRRLAILLFLNGLAIALAATLSLFYIADVLQAEPYSGGFLALYFISGAASLPLWLYLARRMGRPKAWMLGSALAVAGFVWAVQLGAGDLLPYMAICLLAGAALGADLALPAAIAADTIPPQDQGLTGGYFGIWSLINKAVLALAAGMALPLLAWFGYQPGATTGTTSLAVLYAGVPCLIKLTTLALLIRWRTSLEVKHAV